MRWNTRAIIKHPVLVRCMMNVLSECAYGIMLSEKSEAKIVPGSQLPKEQHKTANRLRLGGNGLKALEAKQPVLQKCGIP